jgi:hypothetical protein
VTTHLTAAAVLANFVSRAIPTGARTQSRDQVGLYYQLINLMEHYPNG